MVLTHPSKSRHYVTCPKNTKLDKGAIIGIAVGCSVFGALIIGLLIWWFRSGQYHKYGKPRNLEGGTYQEVKTTDDADAQVVKPLAADYEPPTGGYVENDAKHSDATATLSPNRNLIEKDGVNKNDTETISASIAKS
ncbi:hypothetical protein DL96DRAFT_1722684 [Flagelloscypha sp. PMI_526]|nr:hypothetical protein DL96DRAFT_1722684 [Flagelloscypha sp. PMI_526]